MPNITCGNCRGKHSSVADVRFCYDNWISRDEYVRGLPTAEAAYDEVTSNGSFGDIAEQVYDDNLGYRVAQISPNANSTMDFVPLTNNSSKIDLSPVKSEDRIYLNVPYEDKEEVKKFGGKWDTTKRSWYVSSANAKVFSEDLRQWQPKPIETRKIGDPKPPVAEVKAMTWTKEQLPSGYYALASEDGAWKFYHVSWGKKGSRWEKYSFLAIQVSDELHRVSNQHTRNSIFARIAENPKEAAIQYGHQIGRCSVCNRTLTNPESIDAGIGPVCAGRRGW